MYETSIPALFRVEPERPHYSPEDYETYLYKGFIINPWITSLGLCCLRPVEIGTDSQDDLETWHKVRDWFLSQPERASQNISGMRHVLRNGKVTSCVEIKGDISQTCRVIDRFWEAHLVGY